MCYSLLFLLVLVMSSKCTVFDISDNSLKLNHFSELLLAYSKTRSVKIAQGLAMLTIRVLLLNAKWQDILKDTRKNEICNFIEACFAYIQDSNNISSATIKMQIKFYKYYLNKEQFRDWQKQKISKNYSKLLLKLKNLWHIPPENFQEIHNDIIKFTLIKEEMDNSEDHLAFEEMKTAMERIFPISELPTFVARKSESKLKFLNSISEIAAGIRLHAWYNNKAGEHMFDVCKIMKGMLMKIVEDLHEEYNEIKTKIESLQRNLKVSVLEDNANEDVELFHQKLLLINLTTYYSFLKLLMEDIDAITVNIYKLDYTFAIQINELNKCLKVGVYAEVQEAFPWYRDIAKTWKDMHMENRLLTFYIDLFKKFQPFAQQALSSKLNNAIKIPKIGEKAESKDEKAIIIPSESTKNFEEITLEYQGFCSWYCSLGILIPASREIGIALYANGCYGFSNTDAMYKFLEDPQQCIENVRRLLPFIPELIITFQMEKDYNLPVTNNFSTVKIAPLFVEDRMCQTVLHPVEKHIDLSYNWNQWNLRKQAMKYVDLLDRRTHSTQTNLSHFRRENDSQVYLPKDNWTQTRRDGSTNTPKPGAVELYKPIRTTIL